MLHNDGSMLMDNEYSVNVLYLNIIELKEVSVAFGPPIVSRSPIKASN